MTQWVDYCEGGFPTSVAMWSLNIFYKVHVYINVQMTYVPQAWSVAMYVI